VTSDLTLAGAFPAPTREQWLDLVDGVLKGKPFDRLVHTTYDGLKIQPLYTADDVATTGDESGFPGADPTTRGTDAAPFPGGQWEVRAPVTHPDPAQANAHALEELTAGSTGLILRFDRAVRRGIGPAHPGFADHGAIDGVCIHDSVAFNRALAGVYLDLAPVSFQPGAAFLIAAAWHRELVASSGIDPATVSGCLGADPLGALAAEGVLPQGVDRALEELGHLAAARGPAAAPGLRTAMIDLGPYVEAGATEAQQLAIMLATAAAYLRAMEAAGLEPQAAAAQIEVTLVLDADVFSGIATMRAARRLWAALLETCGVPEIGRKSCIGARTAGRMMTRRDPWVNLLRGTAASFAAAIGGARFVTTLPFDIECGYPDDLGRRTARNTQLLLCEEAHVTAVLDAGGGSWFIEATTEALAEAAWDRFVEIETDGGMVEALRSGTLARRIDDVWTRRRSDVAHRVEPLTGVSEFPMAAEEPVVRAEPDRSGPRAGAVGPLEHVSGSATVVAALPVRRLAADFESLRDAAEQFAARTGHPPRVFLATLGSVASHTARSTWTSNLFEAGGILVIEPGPLLDVDAVAVAFDESGATFACIVGSDSTYADLAAPAAEALLAAGANKVALAGNPGDRRASDEAAGVTLFIHVGIDVVELLSVVQHVLGVTR